MAKNDNLTDFLTDVADAIRAKKGTTAKINPQDFSSEITSIESGGGSNISTFSANGRGKFPFEIGMTWEDYVESEYFNMRYDYDNYITGITDNKVHFSLADVGSFYLDNGERYDYVYPTDTIIPKKDYGLTAKGDWQ